MTKTNPLEQYFRKPSIFLTLPSKGKGYPEGTLDLPVSGSVPIYPMTAKDEILIKTPDALLNGEATVQVIQSCVPSIKNAWDMPASDIDAILIAIRIASHGQYLELSPKCPKCECENHFQLDLTGLLDQAKSTTFRDSIELGEITILLRPLSYKRINQIAMETFEEQRMLVGIQDATMSEQDKISLFTKTLAKIAQISIDVMANCVAGVKLPDGSVVTDEAMLTQFVNNISGDHFDMIKAALEESASKLLKKPFKAVCTEEACKHEWDLPIELDQSSFFG